jgi:enoyl-CoA hydratase
MGQGATRRVVAHSTILSKDRSDLARTIAILFQQQGLWRAVAWHAEKRNWQTNMTDMNTETPPQLASESIGDLRLTREGPVAIVSFNRPSKLNALRRQVWADLRTMIDGLQRDGRTRAVIITGTGERAFSVGGDIAEFSQLQTLELRRAYQTDAMRTFADVETSTLPIIAAVNGWALGGGCELTLACDAVIASDRAMFAMPESVLGLVPGYGVLRAPQIIGRQMTKMLVMSAEKIDAQEALRIGLVQRVVAHAQLMPSALALATTIAGNSSYAHVVGKKLINRGIDRAEFDYSIEALTVLQSAEDACEGLNAFLEKRKPHFRNHTF